MTTQNPTYTNDEIRYAIWSAYKTRPELLKAAKELIQFRASLGADENYLIKLCDAKSRVIRKRLKAS